MRIYTVLVALPLLFGNCVCSSKVGGDLTINGEPFQASGCRSGAAFGFSGVEVTGKSGWRLRLVQTPSGAGRVIAFGPGSTVGGELGECGPFTVKDQNSTVNDVKNVEGKATLSCAADGVSISGTLTFENCH